MKLSSPLLVIAIDYHQMFKTLLDKLPKLKGHVDREIAWAKQHLKKNDRIVWYLRLVRLATISDQQKAGLLPEGTLGKELNAYNAKAPGDDKLSPDAIRGIRDEYRFKRDLEHYMSIEDRDMQSVIFGWQSPLKLFDRLKAIDDVYKEKAKADERMLEPQEGDEPILKFGNGWAWWALSRGYCSEEAKAMGHCGNQGEVTGDQIISLREPRKKGAQTYWEPHLTFIFDKETGLLGEMKGRGNEKPAARYHPYIVSLLKDARVKGIKGGGYAPSHNFSMNDLPEDQRAELEAEKPELMTLKRMLKRLGITNLHRRDQEFPPEIIAKTKALLGLKDTDYDPSQGGFHAYTWKDLPEFVEERGDRTAKWIMAVDQGDESLDFYDSGVDDKTTRELLDDIPKDILTNVGLALEHEYPDELLEFIETQGGAEEFTWEPDVKGDVEDFLAFLEDDQGISTEVQEHLNRAYQYGSESGYQGEMHTVLMRAVEDATDSGERITITHEGEGWWNGKIYAYLKIADAIEAAAECEEGEGCSPSFDENPYLDDIVSDVEVKVGEHHDFYGFDKEHAIETFSEEYGKPPKGYKAKQPKEGQPELFPEVYEPEAVSIPAEGDEEVANKEMERPGMSFGTKGVTH